MNDHYKAMAEEVRSRGRGPDTVLIHMTPDEVGGLQALALAHGGSLTINPETGLPEASFLSKLLPTILGAGLMLIPGVNAIAAAAMVGGGYGIAKGSLKEGLMAGLGAYGGAGLASAMGAGAASAAMPTIGHTALTAPAASSAAAASLPASMGTAAALPSMAGMTAPTFSAPSLMSRFASATAIPGLPASVGPSLAASGLMNAASGAMAPAMPQAYVPPPQKPFGGPYRAAPRVARFPHERDPRDSSEFQYFDNVNPYPAVQPVGYAAGGVTLKDGAFVVDARTVSELGNGSSGAGQELLARLGGQPIKGAGDGVSDDIPANIGGGQEARVARDEVKFDPEAVRRLGGGSAKRGADRLYALMEKAHEARQNADRGEDTNLRGLMAVGRGV